MTPTIAAIYRYPVKGLSPEPLERARLASGRCLPHDRRFAIALPSTRFDPARPEWLSKTHFVMLMRDEKLARLRTAFDAESGALTIRDAGNGDAEPGGTVAVRADLTAPEGRRQVGEFLAA